MRKIQALLILILFTAISLQTRASVHQFSVSKDDVQDGYIIKKIWLEHYGKPSVTLTNTVFEPLSTLPEAAVFANVQEFDLIPGKELKRPFIFVRIPAYSLDENKHPRQLTAFTLQITEQEPEELTTAQKTTASSSILAAGSWYKISVLGRGVYKVDYDFVKNKLGITAAISSSNIRVYGNGGVMLSENNAVARPDDLVENAIQVFDGGDGDFGQGDYFIFYASGPMGWVKDSVNQRFTHRKNLYEDRSYYFLNFDIGAGLRVTTQAGNPSPNTTVTSFNDYMVHEEDLVNVGRFGKEWWGEEFSTEPGKISSRSFSFDLGNLTDSAYIVTYIGSKSPASGNVFNMSLNGQSLGSYNFLATGSNEEDDPIRDQWSSFKLPLNNTASFQLDYYPGASTGKGYLNFIELNTRRSLSFSGGQLAFRDWKSVGAGSIAGYQLQNANSNIQVWDITDPLHPERMNGNITGANYSFAQNANSLHDFIAFDGSQYPVPEYIGTVANQDLHGSGQVDMIIVTHPDFINAANKLADFHRDQDNLRVIVANITQVYNEFSSGSQDISAIRDFARMFYTRAGLDTTQMPKHLLLLGDASFDYKNRLSFNTNFVPSYLTAESISVILGFCSDDFFSFLDDNENIESDGVANTMDLGVGRIPAKSEDEAMAVVNKIINYASPNSLGPWRISSMVMADNRDGAGDHFADGEIMSATVNNNSNLYNLTKVYLDALPMVSTPGGTRAPDANKMINDQIFKGTFLINYSGHGGINTLAGERIVTQDDFNNWKNMNKLPIMVTATCEFSRFDVPEYVSSGEKLILKADGGAIALLTTTQLVYQFLNRPMNKQYLEAQFKQYNGQWPTLGEAFRYGKNVTYSTPGQQLFQLANYRKFALLGDPALKPAFPQYKVETEAFLDGHTMQPVDTLRALGKYVVKGMIKNAGGQLLPDFNGRAYVTIYDKPKTVSTITSPLVTFNTQNNIIFKGKATVTNGLFSLTFISPKDLNYEFGDGKISYYAENGITDAAGMDTTITVGGFSDAPSVEDHPPVVKPFIGDSLFRDGGLTGTNSLLYVQLFDETGINVSGNNVGHDLTAVLDGDVAHPSILNDYYETAPNDYQKGYVFFPLTNLPDGKHELTVKAWDMNNNSGTGTVHFEVANGNVVKIQELINYPNPFSDITHFRFEHNHPDEPLKAEIRIYNSSGSLVRTLAQDFTPVGSHSSEITWDGTNDHAAKLPSGLYIYRVQIATQKENTTTAYQKLVLIR